MASRIAYSEILNSCRKSVTALVLRIFLADDSEQKWKFPSPGDTLVAETFPPNFDSLGELVGKYNGALTRSEAALYSVDRSIIQTRDTRSPMVGSPAKRRNFP